MLTTRNVVNNGELPQHNTCKENYMLDRDKLGQDIMIVELSAIEQANYGSANNGRIR
jgi:hypothetical protein